MSIRDEPPEQSPAKQEPLAVQPLIYVLYGLAGAGVALLLTAASVASEIQRRSPPPVPPSTQLLLLFYCVGLICVLGSVFWLRSRLSGSSLTLQDFSQLIFICFGLANANEVIGLVWVFLGGAFSYGLPLLLVAPVFVLVILLPAVKKRAASLKQNTSPFDRR